MAGIGSPELEQIHYEKLKHVRIFLNSILFRKMHEHSALEVDLVLRGSGKIHTGQGVFCVRSGAILLFNSYEPHEFTADSPEALRILSLQISDRFLDGYCPWLQGVVFRTDSPVLTPERAEQRVLAVKILLAARYYLEETPCSELACVGQIGLILSELLRLLPWETLPDAKYTSVRNKSARIRRITGYIDQHYREKISLAALAAQEGVTPTHLSHFFKEAFHVSFQEYLNALRLEKALVLLRNSDAYLVDICLECGFSDTRYLNQMFLKEFGCTAAEYRRKAADQGRDEHAGSLPPAYAEFSHSRSESLAFVQEALQAEQTSI